MPLKFTVVLVAATLLTLAGCSSTPAAATAPAQPAAAAAVPVKVAQAESRTVPVEIAAIGNVEASSTISVKAQIGGALLKVHFTEGDMVNRDQPLFDIDPRPYQEAIRLAEANLARDKALLAQAEANLARAQAQEAHYGKQAERYEKLAAEGIFSREQADQAAVEARSRRTTVRAETAAIDSARAAIGADEATLANARLNLTYCTIRSPITGRTGALHVKLGNLVKANDVELVTIHQIQPVQVSFAVPEIHLLEIRRRISGIAARISIPGDGQPGPLAPVNFIDNSVDAATGSIRLKATFSNVNQKLWPGQFVDVKLRLAERLDTVVVPAAAVQNGQNGNFAYVVTSAGAVEMRPVKPGPRLDNNTVAVESGLQPGDTVVIEGHLRLAPGMKVRVIS
jgi:multidrug efflux system membrane fusion protein